MTRETETEFEPQRGKDGLFRLLAESAGLGLSIRTSDGEVLYANPALVDLLGFDGPEQITGRAVALLYPEHLRGLLGEEVHPSVLESGRWCGESALRRRDGRVIPVREHIFVIPGGGEAPRRFASIVMDISECKRTEAKMHRHLDRLETLATRQAADLERNEAALRALFDAVPDRMIAYDRDGMILTANAAFAGRCGAPPADLAGRCVFDLEEDDEDAAHSRALHNEVLRRKTPIRREIQRGDRWFDVSVFPVVEKGEVNLLGTFARDITALKTAEQKFLRERAFTDTLVDSLSGIFSEFDSEARSPRPDSGGGPPGPFALARIKNGDEARYAERIRETFEKGRDRIRHMQKLESLGFLAAGIAHDFGNLLVGVLVNADLALRMIPTDSPASPLLNTVKKTAQMMANLSRQVLSFSSRGQFSTEPLDLSRAVEEMSNILDVFHSTKAKVTYNLARNLPAIEGNAPQISQVIMTLIINASEALEGGPGTITVTTKTRPLLRQDLETVDCGDPAGEGPYVVLEVRDTGTGMDEETRESLFEPFFTSKRAGRGLGLSAVRDIVRRHGGAVRVDSEPRKGTTMSVLFPAGGKTAGPAGEAEGPGEDRPFADGPALHATVLVVDDKDTVLDASRALLEKAGCRVRTARCGREALDVFRTQAAGIDLVLLDLSMPEMDGEETLRALREVRKDIPVILSSGFNESWLPEDFADLAPVAFLQKPYLAADLIGMVREALRVP
jgi:PAS domain S-box-containing protein